MDRDRIQELTQILNASSATEISIREGDSFIRIRRAGDVVAVATEDDDASPFSESSPEAAEAAETALVPVAARLVGTFHLQTQGSTQPLAVPGMRVDKGQVIGLIDALGTWTDVTSPAAGEVVEVLAPDDSPVHYGDILMRIKPQEDDQ